jgi:dihydroorotate dehydrogenase
MGKLWERILRPAMFSVDAERAHDIGMRALRLGAASLFSPSTPTDEILAVERFGLTFANPLGMAAGFDKNGQVVGALAELGFGSVEVGTITLEPQPGNPKPRLFRLPADDALINRLGFNNEGAAVVAERIGRLPNRPCVIGVNIGKNKNVANEFAAANYLACFEIMHPVADYIAVNVSSPNTPSLRELQHSDLLSDLITSLQNRNLQLGAKPLLIKIAPDLDAGELESIVATCLDVGISGIIATNTTISRSGLTPGMGGAGGGVSGRPLRSRSTEVIAAVFRLSKGKLTIIGVGGIFDANDAFEKIAAGASLVQAYTGFVYGGPSFASRLNAGLADILHSRGFKGLDDAFGSAIR